METNDNMRSRIITWLSVAERAKRFKTKINTLIIGIYWHNFLRLSVIVKIPI